MKMMQRAGSPYWYVRIYENGKDVWKSTKVKVQGSEKGSARTKAKFQKSKREAEKAAAKIADKREGASDLNRAFENVLRGLNRLDEQERDPRRREFVNRLMAGTTAKLRIEDVFTAWESSAKRKKGAKPATMKGYLSQWNMFVDWLESQEQSFGYKVCFLHEVTNIMAMDYAAHLWAEQGQTANTYNKHIDLLRRIFRDMKTPAGLAGNCWDEIGSEREDKAVSRRELTPKEFRKVFNKAPDEMKAWFALGVYTGQRLVDIVYLKWEDIDFKREEITFDPTKTSRFGKTVKVPMHPHLISMLKGMIGKRTAEGFLFPDTAALYKRERSAITKMIQQHFEDCDIPTTEPHPDPRVNRQIVRVGFHSLRHSFVSMLANNKIPEHVVQGLVGHGSPAMTQHYTHANEKLQKKAIRSLSSSLAASTKKKG